MNETRNSVGYFYESGNGGLHNVTETKSSFGAFLKEGEQSFNERFEQLVEQYKTQGKDIKKDFAGIISDKSFMEQYKNDLLGPIFESFRDVYKNDPHIEKTIDNVNTFWDTKIKTYTESASMIGYLPISTLEFPVLVKQFFSSILKDIIEVESVKSPNITKHIRTTYLVDNQTGNEYEYPKCMFDGTWEKVFTASKGLKIPETVVPLDAHGRLYKYDIITFAHGVPGVDQISFQFKIISIQVGGNVIPLRGNGITVEFSTNGTLVNGDLKFDHNGTAIEDTIVGQVDFHAGTVTLASTKGQVTGVVFSGYLSNEKNTRSVSVREKRDLLRFTIEDGPRWNMPFSIEEIEDAAALLDINYYNRMVDEIVKTQEMQECMTVIKFLNDEFKKYNGISTDTWKLESVAQVHQVDLNPSSMVANFAGDPYKFMSTAIQFKLKSIIHQITELTKLEDLSFVIVGNPMATQLIAEFVNWKSQSGTTIGGITVNNSYGFATDMGANVRVVATNLFDAYTVEKVTPTNKRELVLHIYGYPTDKEHISQQHLKYTSHLFTSQSQTAYQSVAAAGGAYNIVTATSRFSTISIQGIQSRLILLNSERVYGVAPDRPPVVGAPWA